MPISEIPSSANAAMLDLLKLLFCFVKYLIIKHDFLFYYKILVWLFWVVLSFITGCVPLILLILLVGLWDIEEANKPR